MTVLFKSILALHIIKFSSCQNYGGGGAKRYVCPPPPYFHWGAADPPPPPPPPPQDRCLWYSGGSRICKQKNGGALRAPRARQPASYGWGPCRGPRGRRARKLSSFQQIRAFKMVVSLRSCNFAYRALVGGRGCGSHHIFRSS